MLFTTIFFKISEAYNIKIIRINNDNELEEKISEALNYDGPVIIDVNCHEYHTYEPRIFGWKTPIEDMYPYVDRDEFFENMSIAPLEDWMNPAYPDIVK